MSHLIDEHILSLIHVQFPTKSLDFSMRTVIHTALRGRPGLYLEMSLKPHLTSEHAGGMQPCSALDNLRSGAKREQSQAPQRAKQLSSSICQTPVT